ncbi:hypothetical protein Tco_0620977 [Tanacetum coccineum]
MRGYEVTLIRVRRSGAQGCKAWRPSCIAWSGGQGWWSGGQDVGVDEEPRWINWGAKRRRAGKETESTSAPKEKTSKTTGKSTDGATAEQSDEETTQHPDWFQKPAKPPTPNRDWNKTLPVVHGQYTTLLSPSAREEGPRQQFPHDLRKLLPLIPNSRGRQVIPFNHFINNDLAYLSGGVSSRTYATSVTKTQAADYGDFKWLHLQDIKDMLILLVQGKLTNLNVEDHQDLKTKRMPYTAYSIPRGFIYLNKDKKNRLMRIDELHKFSDGTLDDVRTALNDRLKGIRMEYLPKTIWRQSDRERAKAMIQAIEKMLKSRRIMRSLERFVGGRPFETSAGNPIKEILLKLDLPDHRILKDGGEVKKFKKDGTLKLFMLTNQERCSRSHSRQAEEQAQDLKSMITTSNHKLMIEVKPELKAKIKCIVLPRFKFL